MSKKLPDLYLRMVYSIFILGAVGTLLFFAKDKDVFWVLSGIVAFLAGVAAWEFARFSKIRIPEIKPLVVAVMAALTTFSFAITAFFNLSTSLPILMVIISIIIFALFYVRAPENAINTISVSFFGLCYVAVPLGLIIYILHIPYIRDLVEQDGRYWVVYLLAVTKVTDIVAYFVGKLFGKHKLALTISPQKTLEGAIGGFLGAVSFSLLFALLSALYFENSFSLGFLESLWIGACVGLFAQVGDLLESLFKRDAAVKDSSAIPAIGGVLDMLDSLLITIPIIYFFILS